MRRSSLQRRRRSTHRSNRRRGGDSTTEFAIASIARWWSQVGRKVYEKATELLITADAPGVRRLHRTDARRIAFPVRQPAGRPTGEIIVVPLL
jgi:hypothetical protein